MFSCLRPHLNLVTTFFSFIVLAIGHTQGLNFTQKPAPAQAFNFTQLLNHVNNDSRTFNQSYQIDTTWFRPGGPILFRQGDEDPIPIAVSDAIHNEVMFDYAPELGALQVAIKHRFFGSSFPEDFNADDPDSYTSLTVDNIVQYSVTLVEYIK
jgi:hypothetical protein